MRNILVANRGEIAWRIMRTARALGYRTTAIYSEADTHSPHVSFADSAVCIGPPPVGASYLDAARVLDAARSAGADALHPGYGLLSENADFAQACSDAGLTFIGPRPDTIRLMGDKRRARIAVQAQGVACVPGYDGEDQTDEVLLREAARIGFPIMVKAAAGGGGRGMRRVTTAADLSEAIARARSEAESAFGVDRLILERAIEGGRHVEVQVFADNHGHVIHLGERDCSLQRRFQKLIEEAPSPAVDAALRQRMGELAVRVAKAADYLGAGTVELLLTAAGEVYFLEMNTRLQVEHPVTELVTRLDLVEWQLRVAEGEPLPLAQSAIQLTGHAIEARLYAEQPELGFLPATGRVLQLHLPDAYVRVDHTLKPGLDIGTHYDALLGKLIAHGADREAARRKLVRALAELRLLGVATNQAFLRTLLEQPVFVEGRATTDYLDRQPAPARSSPASVLQLSAAAIAFVTRAEGGATYAAELAHFVSCAGLCAPLVLDCDGVISALEVETLPGGSFLVRIGESSVKVAVAQRGEQASELVFDQLRQHVQHAFQGERLFLQTPEGPRSFLDITHAPKRSSSAASSGRALAPMDGAVIDVPVRVGQQVDHGQTLVVVEAMKLEQRVAADRAGVVSAIHVARGTQVKARQLLVEVSAAGAHVPA
jgi:geranyl-CoA carboxylase alpha subunit